MTLKEKLFESFKCGVIVGALGFVLIGAFVFIIAPQKTLLDAGLAFFLMFAAGFAIVLHELNTN